MAWGDEYTTVGNYGQYGSGSSNGTASGAQANSKMNWGGLVNGATSLYELYNAYQASKKPKVDFAQPPLSPEQRKMWDLAYRAVSQLPTAQMLGPMAQSILGGYSGMGWKGQGNVAIPYYGMQASGPSYSSPNTQYQLGPQYWPTQGQGQGGASVTPPPDFSGSTNGGEPIEPRQRNGVRGLEQRDQGAPEPYSELGSEWTGATPYLGKPGDGAHLSGDALRGALGRVRGYLADHPNAGRDALVTLFGPAAGFAYDLIHGAVNTGRRLMGGGGGGNAGNAGNGGGSGFVPGSFSGAGGSN